MSFRSFHMCAVLSVSNVDLLVLMIFYFVNRLFILAHGLRLAKAPPLVIKSNKVRAGPPARGGTGSPARGGTCSPARGGTGPPARGGTGPPARRGRVRRRAGGRVPGVTLLFEDPDRVIR